ncbi:Cation channel sperm-associated protein 3 [Sorochytrium milnesiophthora]
MSGPIFSNSYGASWRAFNWAILAVVFINCITIAFEANLSNDQSAAFAYLDDAYLAIYTIEFALKIVVMRRLYFQNGYNRFDAAILLASWIQFSIAFFGSSIGNLTFLRVFRALRALKSFRSVSSVRQLQVLVNALLKTFRSNLFDIVACMFLFVFIFAVLGYYAFSECACGAAMSSGWSDIQQSLTASGYAGSEYYSIATLFVCNFIFTNMFIGVICENIEDATEADMQSQRRLRQIAQQGKKEAYMEKQKQGMDSFLADNEITGDTKLQDVLQKLAGSLRHDEIVPMSHTSCSLQWIETYLLTQYHIENSLYRCQQVHFGLANTLAELAERRARARAH